MRRVLGLVLAVADLSGCGHEEGSSPTKQDTNAFAAAFKKTNDIAVSAPIPPANQVLDVSNYVAEVAE